MLVPLLTESKTNWPKKWSVLKVQNGWKKGDKGEKKRNQNTKSIHTAIDHELNEHRRMCHASKMQNPTVEKQITEWEKSRGKRTTEASQST